MKELKLSLKEVIDEITEEQATKRNLPKKVARQLVINALTYNLVTNEIDSQIDYLLGEAD